MAAEKVIDVKSYAGNQSIWSDEGEIVSSTSRRGFLRCKNKRNLPVLVALAVACMTSGQVDAAIVNVTQGSTSGYTMTDGNTYVIKNSVSFLNSTTGGSGMSVEDGATVVLYVPAGVTLTATGANGSGRTGGGAGIHVPETSTLVITGEGTVNATGGNAGNGGNGADGSTGTISPYNSTSYSANSGVGGSGGNGGGGAGTGIGGTGGNGGNGGSGGKASVSQKATDVNKFCKDGNVGSQGGNGVISSGMGKCYVLGATVVNASCGMSGEGGDAGNIASWFVSYNTNQVLPDKYATCGGGGGGGGGAGSAPTKAIGGGGSAGGGGGGGGSGALVARNGTMKNANGGGGCGGSSSTAGGVSGADKGWSYGGTSSANTKYYGGNGGSGGTAGAEGNAGTLYVSSTATVNVEREKLSATTHPAAQYTITFDVNGGQFSSPDESLTATLGCELPDCIPNPQKNGCVFAGWAVDPEGTTMWYGSEGDKEICAYAIPENTTLYAVWIPLIVGTPVISPESGTTFGTSLTVTMSCPTEGATIHYTTDGSDPTAESPVYSRFRIYGRTTVKAVAEKNGLLSDVATAEYALGRCVDPVFSLADGASFAHSNQVVSIRWHYDGVLRYTIDGTDPTVESPIYEGPFAVSDSIELRAKVFSDDFFESSIVTSRLTRVWENVVTPQINAADSFTGSKRKVVISCATEGVTVRYTLNGNEPNSHSTKYTGPFYVTGSCIVKAYAVMADYLDSAVATQEIVKVWGIGDAMGKPDHAFSTDGSGGAGWTRVADATAPNGEAMKSGAISHNQSSVLSTKVMGPGTLTFSWRTSCEEDELHEWDHAEFSVDGMVLLRRDGVNSWREESVRIEGDGEHAVAWTYTKDNVESEGEDAAWVAGYGWASDYVETKTTAVPVPYAWLLRHDPEIVDEFDAYETAAKEVGENGYMLWESYVIGVNPNDRNDNLRITAFSLKADGTLDLDSIEVSPSKSQ